MIKNVRLAVWIILFHAPPKWGADGGLKTPLYSGRLRFFFNGITNAFVQVVLEGTTGTNKIGSIAGTQKAWFYPSSEESSKGGQETVACKGGTGV